MTYQEDYPKKILTFDNQIQQLRDRGLIIENVNSAKEFLRNISYFRLQGFWWEFQDNKETHTFQKGTTFEDIINLYSFDRKFRAIIFDAIERIEIALRTKLIYYPSIELGQWWFEDFDNFYSNNFLKQSLEEIDKELGRTKEVFIKSHYSKYGSEHRPPAYKTLEVISFGCLSKLYSNLNNNITAKNRVAKEFNLPNHFFLKSWLQSFNTIRNIIAHHSRIWNRNIDFSPKFLHTTEFDFIEKPINEHSMYHCMSCLIFLLNKVSKGHSLKEKIINLLEENHFLNISEIGIPSNWREQAIWK
jgi:abortive infection bacteriophage resistance protein